MLQRNIAGEHFIGFSKRFDSKTATDLAQRIRNHGRNARIIDSAGKKRIYLGNRRYKKRFKDIRGESPFDPKFGNVDGARTSGGRRTVAPDVMGSYDPGNLIRTRQYIDWKNNAYKNSPDLRYVAIGVAQLENKKFPDGRLYQTPTTKQPYLLSIGLVPSNIATMHLASLGFDVSNGPIKEWYSQDKNLRDETWHQTNLSNFEYHLNDQGLKPATKREMMEDFMYPAKPGNAYDDDGIIQKYSYVPVYKIGPSDIASKEDALEIDKGFSELFDFDEGQRLRRLSDFLPLIHFYMTDMEIEDWVSNVNARAKGITYDRNRSQNQSYMPREKSLYREPMEDIFLESLKPDYEKVLDRNADSVNRLITDDFTYDFINLQRGGWGTERNSDRRDPFEQYVFLPYFNPQSIPYDGGFRPEKNIPWPSRKMTDEQWNEWITGSEWWANKIDNAEIAYDLYQQMEGRGAWPDSERNLLRSPWTPAGSVVDSMREMPVLDMGEATNNDMNDVIKAKRLVDKISMAMSEFPITYSRSDGSGATVDIFGSWTSPSEWTAMPSPAWSEFVTPGEPLPRLPSKADLMRALD